MISTKTFPASGDWKNAMWEILRDIKAHPGRESKSIVTTAMAVGKKMTPAEAKADKNIQELYGDDLRESSRLGVPFVTAAGNGNLPREPRDVYQIPSMLQDDDIPIIVVGAADYSGKKWDRSQTGDLVTLYTQVSTLSASTRTAQSSLIAALRLVRPNQILEYEPKSDSTFASAAPQVAGLIATYISYATKPWDDTKTGVDRINAIIEYLVSEDSSDERAANSGIRMIWNGATEDNHRHPQPEGTEYEPEPSDPGPTPAPELRNKVLSIIMQSYIDPILSESSWQFFASDYGVSSLCHESREAVLSVTLDGSPNVNNPPWPGGGFVLPNLDGMYCDYLNDGSNPGALWCHDRTERSKKVMISCREEDRKKG
jgi:hypothetical protein